MMLTDLDRTLRAAGLSVAEVPGWRTRGHGQMNAVKTITIHHTANGGAKGNAPSLAVVRDGRPGLKGPLSQLLLAKDGTWYVVAAGVGWHAGESLEPRYGNLWAVGIEAEAVGVPGAAGDWPEVQMRSYARGVAALMIRYALTIDDVKGHKETAAPLGRKSDPSFDMNTFRRRVSAVDLEDDVALSPDDIDKIAKAVWGLERKLTDADVSALGGSVTTGDMTSINTLLRFPPAVARLRREQTERLAEISVEVSDLRKIAAQQAKLITELLTRLKA